jgi:hypothetical protein
MSLLLLKCLYSGHLSHCNDTAISDTYIIKRSLNRLSSVDLVIVHTVRLLYLVIVYLVIVFIERWLRKQ